MVAPGSVGVGSGGGSVRKRCSRIGWRACRSHSRAYLRHLHEQNDPLYGRLATIHNIFFFHQWVGALRTALRAGTFSQVSAQFSQIITDHYVREPKPASTPIARPPVEPPRETPAKASDTGAAS